MLRAMSCAMGLVGATDISHLQCCAYQNIAGTTRSAELKPELPAYPLPPQSSQKKNQHLTYKKRDSLPDGGISTTTFHKSPETLEDDEFGDDDFKDQEVINAGKFNSLYRS